MPRKNFAHYLGLALFGVGFFCGLSLIAIGLASEGWVAGIGLVLLPPFFVATVAWIFGPVRYGDGMGSERAESAAETRLRVAA